MPVGPSKKVVTDSPEQGDPKRKATKIASESKEACVEKKLADPSVEELSSQEHRAARRLVFEKIVSATIQDPNHPYYSLVPQQLRQDMIDEITEQLVDSHYFNA